MRNVNLKLKKTFSIYVVFLFVLSLLLLNMQNVVAGTIYTDDLEDYPTGVQIGNQYFYTVKLSGSAFTTSSYHKSGSISYRNSDTAKFKLFVNDSFNYFEFWTRMPSGPIVGSSPVWDLYINDTSGKSINLAQWSFSFGSYYPVMRASDSAWYETTKTTWDKIKISYVSDTILNVSFYNITGVWKIGKNVALSFYLDDFSHFYFYASVPVGYSIYHDDFSVEIGLAGCDLTSYNSKGNTIATGFMSTSDWWLEQLYRIPTNATITGVELAVSPLQYSFITSDPNDYILRINGDLVGAANEFNIYGANYVLKWCGFSYVVDGTILFEWQQAAHLDGSLYWYAAIVNGDADGDGTAEWAHSTGGIGYYGGTLISGSDLAYKFYYENMIFVNETSPFTDLLTVPKTEYMTYENVLLAYFVSTFEHTNYIELYHDGTQISEQLFTYEIPLGSFSEEIGHTPLHTGNYKYVLVRNSVNICSVNITVTENPYENFSIFSYPNPYDYDTDFKIGYRYYNPSGLQGLILLGTSQFLNDTSEADYYWFINSNTSGNFTYHGTDNYYIKLFYQPSSGYYYLIDTIYQQLRYQFAEDTIVAQPGSYTLDSQHPSVLETLSGYHRWLGYNVYVTVNNGFVGDVGGSNWYSVQKLIDSPGNYLAELKLNSVNGTISLANTTFVISGTPSLAPPVDAWSFLGEYRSVFAIGFILMFFLIPAVVSSRLGIEIPLLGYIGAGAMGVGFCTVTGLLPLYFIFFIVVALVSIAVIMVFR